MVAENTASTDVLLFPIVLRYDIIDKDMELNPGIDVNKEQKIKLGQLLKYDTLFKAYPELSNYTVELKKMKKGLNGSIHYNNLRINTDTKNKSNTLIHEIQHAIQKIEGFERGTTSKLSKLRYYNKLGEIEADDVAKRYEKNTNLYDVAPESSKANPKHSRLDGYLTNKKIIDKIKDGIFEYFNIGGQNHEISEETDTESLGQNSSLVDGRRNLKELEKCTEPKKLDNIN